MKRRLSCCVVAALAALVASAQQRTISFSGHNWWVKKSSSRVGPGPNFFSDSANHVWVDSEGRLHLKIARSGNRWYCAEVVSAESFGYGTYRFYLASAVDALDPNVVLGPFTLNDDPAYNHRELDIEFARWADRKSLNAQYVVQPYTVAENMYRFNQPAGVPESNHSFLWTEQEASFLSLRGLVPLRLSDNVIAEHSFTSGIPVAGGENARINLWLFRGRAPTNRQPVEIVISRFEFIP